MRWVLGVAALSMALGCGELNDAAKAPPGGKCTGSVTIASNADGDAMAARGCTSLAGVLYITGASVTRVDLPALTRIENDLSISDASVLTSISLPALTTISGDLWVRSDSALTALGLPKLTTVGGNMYVLSNPTLPDLSFPSLTTVVGSLVGNLSFEENSALTSLSLPVLNTLPGSLSISSNTVLPQCLAVALKDHLVAEHGFTGSWTITGNDTIAVCP
jgi:hypothetical protein